MLRIVPGTPPHGKPLAVHLWAWDGFQGMLRTMADQTPKPGAVGWVDLTVDDAPSIRDFYAEVLGWKPEPVPMGGYDDYTMCDGAGTARAGVCHRRGANEAIPPAWMVYFTVSDLPASLAAAVRRGAQVLVAPKPGSNPFAIIKDPAGAVCALYQVETPGEKE